MQESRPGQGGGLAGASERCDSDRDLPRWRQRAGIRGLPDSRRLQTQRPRWVTQRPLSLNLPQTLQTPPGAVQVLNMKQFPIQACCPLHNAAEDSQAIVASPQHLLTQGRCSSLRLRRMARVPRGPWRRGGPTCTSPARRAARVSSGEQGPPLALRAP